LIERLGEGERPARVFQKGCLWQENLAESVKEKGRMGDWVTGRDDTGCWILYYN